MFMNHPKVTAIVACYNHARFVPEALNSVKAQDYPSIELVVMDDCSKDNSVAVIQEWLKQNWPEATLIAHKTNVGVCRTLNDALRHAHGKHIRLLAADDVWLPQTLGGQVELMEESSAEVGVVYSDAYTMNASGETLQEMFIASHRKAQGILDGWLFETLLQSNFIPAMTALIRRSCFEAVGTYDESLAFEDWDMWLRISHEFRFRYYPEATARYRIVGTSMMRTMSGQILESRNKILIKCLRQGWLTGKIKEAAIYHQNQAAWKACQEGGPKKLAQAAEALRWKITPKNLLLFLRVLLGVPYGLCIKLLGNVQPLRPHDETPV
jgi:glycosyltransferase involved in cell wall biosynthesis